MKSRARADLSLERALGPYFDRGFAEIPEVTRQLIARCLPRLAGHMSHWDSLPRSERKRQALIWDAQHPTTVVEKEHARIGFATGGKRWSIPLRNKRNARHPRPSRRSVQDADILRIKAVLDSQGVPLHRQCRMARDALVAEGRSKPMSIQGFRKRWRRLITNSKEET